MRPAYVCLLGYATFAFLDGHEAWPTRLTVRAPRGWPVFATMAPTLPLHKGTATYETANYYALADAQVMMGPALKVRRFDAAVPLYLAVYAETEVDLQVIGQLAVRAMNDVVAYFGSAPMSSYTVHQEYLDPLTPEHIYGFSMEHLTGEVFK